MWIATGYCWLAGLLWSVVRIGAVCCRLPRVIISGLAGEPGDALSGFVCGVMGYAFAFQPNRSSQNLARIGSATAPGLYVCIPGLEKSYALIIVMITLGWMLRHSRLPLLY